jgi:single-strand DNA-binding protein
MDLNKVFLIGRLTQDPDSKMLSTGTAVANFGLATNRYFKDKSGQKQQQVEFHNIVAFGKIAESTAQYLRKGSLALIEGRIRTRSWDNKEGKKQYKTEIVAERIQFGPKTTNPKESNKPNKKSGPSSQKQQKEEIPVIEEDKEINIKDIPF